MSISKLLGDDGNIILQHPPHGLPDGHPLTVTLRDVFNQLAQGRSTKAIRRLEPHITRETIVFARAFLIANYYAVYREHIAKRDHGDLRMLVDECLPARIIPTICKGFGYATHTNFVKLNGQKDSVVWRWAVNNNIDAIITRDWRETNPDEDLTLIAKVHALNIIERMQASGQESADLSELPIIVHMKIGSSKYSTVSALFDDFREDIHAHIQTRVAPAIAVTRSGVVVKETYESLWNQYLSQRSITVEHLTRAESRENKWMKIILAGKTGVSEEQRAVLRNMVRQAAAICSRVPSMPMHPQNDPSPQPS